MPIRLFQTIHSTRQDLCYPLDGTLLIFTYSGKALGNHKLLSTAASSVATCIVTMIGCSEPEPR